MIFNKEPKVDVHLMDKDEFKGYYGEELLAHLMSCDDIKFGNTLNFSTNTRFEGLEQIPTMVAFNSFLMSYRNYTDRIIISL